MKRAALIITDAHLLSVGEWTARWAEHLGSRTATPSEQLLADLRALVITGRQNERLLVRNAAARVRALLPEEEA